MHVVTIVLPVSREENLDTIFTRLELLECDRKKTNLLCIVDGTPDLFVNVRNRVELSKFNDRLCIQFGNKKKGRRFDYLSRRYRIADIHNQLKENIKDCDYVFGIEDDTIFNVGSLKILLKDYDEEPYAGFIQGVQLGRWGIPHVGAWRVDDVYDPKTIESVLKSKKRLDQIDAGGFYLFLTKRDHYVNHEFKPFDGDGMGPDFDFGISMRTRGMINFIDWSLTTVHRTPKGDVSMLNTSPRQVRFIKKENRWRQTHL